MADQTRGNELQLDGKLQKRTSQSNIDEKSLIDLLDVVGIRVLDSKGKSKARGNVYDEQEIHDKLRNSNLFPKTKVEDSLLSTAQM